MKAIAKYPGSKGYVIISGYETELYDTKLRNWKKYKRTAYSQVCSKKKEVIWLNYEPPMQQLSFLDTEVEDEEMSEVWK